MVALYLCGASEAFENTPAGGHRLTAIRLRCRPCPLAWPRLAVFLLRMLDNCSIYDDLVRFDVVLGLQAQVDAWMDFAVSEVEVPVSFLVYPTLGYMTAKPPVTAKAEEDLRRALEVMERHLTYRTFFVGETVTLADISLAAALYYPFRLMLVEEDRVAFPCVTRWFTTCVNQPAFHAVLGDVVLCQERVVASAGKQGGKKQQNKQGGKKQQQQGKKQEKKKETGGAASGGGSAASPAPATPKPTDAFANLAPSTMNMDEFKRHYSNAPKGADGERDFGAAVRSFWDSLYDKDGYSIWICNYKFNHENRVEFMVSNLVGGFIQRTDPIRKYAFGVMHILGDAAPFEVTGCWMIRGQSIEPMLEANPDSEYYEWIKVDTADPEQRRKVEEYWSATEKLYGKTIADDKLFK